MRLQRGINRRATSAFLLVCIGVFFSPNSALADERNDNLDIIVLVDESSSLSPLDVKAEQDALRSMIQIPILRDRNIRLGVLPFSSGQQSPRLLDSCALTDMDLAGQKQFYNNCPQLITRQLEGNSDDTNFASAITAALGIFEESTVNNNRIPVILLLTDGKYDPDGDLSTSSEEQNLLDDALAKARKLNASVWPIGFGDADGLALIAMSLAGATLPENCPSKPSASIAASTDLGLQMTNILSSVICVSPPTPPEATPAKLLVHPMMDTLAVSVKVVGSGEPILKDPDGNVVCEGTWDKLGEYSSCLISLDGDTAGEWSLIASDGSQVTWQQSGVLKVTLDSCESPGNDPTVLVRRADEKFIDWEGSNDWPRADVEQFTSSGERLISTIVDLDQEKIQVPVVDKTNKLSVKLAEAEDTVRGLSFSMDASCVIASPPSTTVVSSVAPPTSVVVNSTLPPEDPDDSPGGPFNIMTALLAVALFAITGYVARRIFRSKVFENGTQVFQESNVKQGVFIELDGDIGGKRSFGLSKSGGQLLEIVSPKSEPTMIVSKEKDEIKIILVSRSDAEDDPSTNVDEDEVTTYFTSFGVPITISHLVKNVLNKITIRVDRPNEDEFEGED